MQFAAAVGQVLRKLRTDRDLTLHGVQDLSKGAFKASALSGYERGERSISLERFREVTGLYEVPADVALRDVLDLIDERTPKRVVDITDKSIDLTDDSEELASRPLQG
jgi:transcriptional regulator with XRE-family HTH domain